MRAGLRLGERDELRNGLRRDGRIHDQDELSRGRQRDRRELAEQIVREVLVEDRVDHLARRRHEERVAVRRRLRRDLRADVAAGAGAVVDDDLLAELGRKAARRRCARRNPRRCPPTKARSGGSVCSDKAGRRRLRRSRAQPRRSEMHMHAMNPNRIRSSSYKIAMRSIIHCREPLMTSRSIRNDNHQCRTCSTRHLTAELEKATAREGG